MYSIYVAIGPLPLVYSKQSVTSAQYRSVCDKLQETRKSLLIPVTLSA